MRPATFVTSDSLLARLCTRWSGLTHIAVDTEFERSTTFFTRPALLQVADGADHYLIDPLEITDFGPFLALLGSIRPTKVIHACSEDLQVFERLGTVVPAGIFDTQVAAAFLGHGYATAYRSLVMEVMGVGIPKQETRSDWLRRPLSPAQSEYAMLDVAHLLPIHAMQVRALAARDRGTWVEEECARLIEQGKYNADPGNAYKRLGQAWQLERRNLAVLRAVCAWREHEARTRDVPRSRVVTNEALFSISRHAPCDVDALRALEALKNREHQRSAATIVRIVNRVMSLGDEHLPEALPRPSDLDRYRERLRALKCAVKHKADALGIAPELLARGRALEALVRHALIEHRKGLPPYFSGWRQNVIGAELLAMLH